MFFRALATPVAASVLALLTLPAAAEELRHAALPVPAAVEAAAHRAGELPTLRSIIIARDGVVLAEKVHRGPPLDRPTAVKSLSKTFLAALVGIAIERGVLDGVGQSVAALLPGDLPPDPDPRLQRLTVGHLLSMRAGLQRTSGPNYGRFVTSANWVRHTLSRPFEVEPGSEMRYSTGNYHLLSAILTRRAGRSTLAMARDWLGEPLGIRVPAWQTDPQGIYFGGNNMSLSPRALLKLGELYRRDGVYDGQRILPEGWVRASWTARAHSRHTGHGYGYGWFVHRLGGYDAYYGWGYGGQLIYVVPDLALTVVITSDPNQPSGRTGYVRDLHRLVADDIIPAVAVDGRS